ncbi:MAG TPA: hydrogenase expression/formation protein HypE [Candidatus Krumholzibacteria bacterium]|nr:hydrogenase expression/formation protein HypE [Candidatus Krumholzibacteria bacterium]HPD70334.1 hydrogenase expression/formation protein HypE [Candidatus Krumholzibacteria bacterium]HRY39966.1 hydrogenase expression/formation protein HypE [Candidatus Krumholzibacteria bacterium]
MKDRGDLAGGPICPVPLVHDERIVLGHGSGGRLTADLIARVFRPQLANPSLAAAEDSAVLPVAALAGAGELALTTDTYVVRPLFFPGGDIGRLAVCGTVNDLAMVGAEPMWLTAGFLLEEGFPIADLERIVASLRDAAAEAGVTVVAGDTKVAERGKVDGVYINTAGVGRISPGRAARAAQIRPGDAILLSGTIGDHGIAVLAARGDLAFRTEIRSDVAPLAGLVAAMLATGAPVHALRDPTRGGVAATLNELAAQSATAMILQESSLPVQPAVASACEMLGFDPLHVANEGKLLACVPEASAERVLAAMRAHPLGRNACRIGRVAAEPVARVLLETGIGGVRIIDVPAGELLPRIC